MGRSSFKKKETKMTTPLNLNYKLSITGDVVIVIKDDGFINKLNNSIEELSTLLNFTFIVFTTNKKFHKISRLHYYFKVFDENSYS